MIKGVICQRCHKHLANYNDETGTIILRDLAKLSTEPYTSEVPYSILLEKVNIYCMCGEKSELLIQIGINE